MPTYLSDDPQFATDAAYASDGDPWAGDPPRVDPGSTIRAEGFEPGALPAEWLNYILGNHGDALATIDHELEYWPAAQTRLEISTDVRAAYVPSVSALSTWNSADNRPHWLEGLGSTESLMTCPYSDGRLIWILTAGYGLPQHIRITSLRVYVKPGAARATESNRMRLQAFTRTSIYGGAGSSLGSVYDDGTTDAQYLTLSGLNFELYIAAGRQVSVLLDAGDDTSVDFAYMLDVQYEIIKL